MISRALPTVAALAVLAAGCSSGDYKVAKVSGKVTLNGKPIPRAAVMFQPVAIGKNINPGPGSTGVTDAEGRYTLTLVGTDSKGAVVGKHKVRITNFEEPGDSADDRPRPAAKPAVPVPPKYNKQEAILEFDVPARGSDAADFELDSK
jgi:hypothetical protein